MKNIRMTTEQKLSVLQEGTEKGAVIKAVCDKYGISTPTFYKWRAEAETGKLSEDKTTSPPKKSGNAIFRPQSDKDLAQTVLRLAAKEAESRGVSSDRFVAEALQFALNHMR